MKATLYSRITSLLKRLIKPLLKPALILAFIALPGVLVLMFDGGGSAGACGKRFGGPYSMSKSLPQDKVDAKLADFGLYSGLDLTFSKTHRLAGDGQRDFNTFVNSVNANADISTVSQQRYNYVITEDCSILVTVWTEMLPALEGDSAACAGGADPFTLQTSDFMIDFALEDPFGARLRADKSSPCWLDPQRGKGILDALGKHFMMAQGAGTSISDYPLNSKPEQSTWSHRKVAYAGEILVDLRACTYIATEFSGTYQPKGEFRLTVNAFFAETLHLAEEGLPNPIAIDGCRTVTPTSTPTRAPTQCGCATATPTVTPTTTPTP